ncbi:beta-glucosidase A [Diaporthe amygdali]|uniref:beta-glucosidase A n=1 Tax=Phomopsis amygdali TaxID=1214568 RepID=UPI0022FDDE90|nr:beta-glucosidase A [Diaporthe amygdali]KAJ0117969.1 beta-glucosidase A [Diaporthe amygdali]
MKQSILLVALCELLAGVAAQSATNLSLDELWDKYVGPVSTSPVNATVDPVPVPSESLIPPPPLYYPTLPFPGGAQVPLQARNENIARIAALGLNTYAFSISWSRIFPFGSGEPNEAGLQHYDDVIDTCLQYGITPVVTLYHWDLPLSLQLNYGGWLNEQITNDFSEYARVAFARWSPKVEYWVTLNEPGVFCNSYPLPQGYFNDSTTADIPDAQQFYVCARNALLAHSSAYRIGKSVNSSLSISFKNNGGYKIPVDNSPDTAAAVQRAYDFNDGLWATPVFLTGDFPESVKDYVSGFLPAFTAEQKAQINGTSDIFMIDAYGTGGFVTVPEAGGLQACISNASHRSYPRCYGGVSTYPGANYWPTGPAVDPCASWLAYGTDWVPAMLKTYQEMFKPVGGIVVSEFGLPEPYEGLRTDLQSIVIDPLRSRYYREYMQSILMAMAEGINVVGTLAWSILDNFEWDHGYSCRFGLQYVNFTTQERYFKASAFEYVNMFQTYQE